jgi:hypothetical protein
MPLHKGLPLQSVREWCLLREYLYPPPPHLIQNTASAEMILFRTPFMKAQENAAKAGNRTPDT